MPTVIMPKMGDAMEEGTLLKWLKEQGDEVAEGDPLAEIETDKVTLEINAEFSGTLTQRLANEARPGKGRVGRGIVCGTCRVDPGAVRAK